MGHMYENWFADSAEVAGFLAGHYGEHRAKVEAFADAMYDTA